ncbi:hypothetical protein FACS1894181_17360 [Bacteroidia bacterium]|nr:hypothetical protein FACS1894181_17360 [Bacteroidia bacterium]
MNTITRLILVSFVSTAFLSCTKESALPGGAGVHFDLPHPFANPANDDEAFFNFRFKRFAPGTEPFIKETFGNDLRWEPGGFWEYNSYTSHVVGFSTNLPACSILQYGETTDYGHATSPSESYFYQHLHYIRDLQPGKTYHYRIVAQDYDGAQIASGDYTFTPREPSNVIRIPDDFRGEAPYVLEESGATYVLTRDITVPTMAINIKANDVILDLDGHTIIYDDGTPKVTGGGGLDYAYNEDATYGIRSGLWNFRNITVLNGTIKQGRNGGAGFGMGFSPLYLHLALPDTHNEIAGVTVDFYGEDIAGIVPGNGYVHHNVLYDRGNVVTDRHAAIRAIDAGNASYTEIAYNSLRRFRQRGIDGGGKHHHNELYSDSFVTNSFMLGAGDGVTVTDNKLFGMGYNPIGIGWGSHLYVARNFMYLIGYAPTQRSDEYARKSGIAGMRSSCITCEDMLFEDNIAVLKAEDGCTLARGIWAWTPFDIRNKRIVYRKNLIKVEAMPGNVINDSEIYYNGDVNNAVTCVTVQGSAFDDSGEVTPDPIIFEDNRLIGNVNLVTIGEGYGIASSVWMYRTKLEKITRDSEYFRPVRLGFWYWNTFNNRMIDTELGDGITNADMAPYFFGGTGKMEIRYGESKTLLFVDSQGRPIAGKAITLALEDASGQTIQTDANGKATFDLPTVRHYKYGSSKENDGLTGESLRTDYKQYTFNLAGYKPYTIATADLKRETTIILAAVEDSSLRSE